MPSPLDTPPLPELPGQAPPNVGIKTKNTWWHKTQSVPIYAQRQRMNTPSVTRLPQGVRSGIRTGTLTFTEEGMAIQGMEVIPTPVLQRALLLFYLALSLVLLFSSMRKVSMYTAVSMVLVPLVPPILRWHGERQQRPITVLIPWSQFIGVLSERKMDGVLLVYYASLEETGWNRKNKTHETQLQQGTCELSLNKLDPVTVAGIVETVQHFSPYCIVTRTEGFQWTTGRKIAYGIIGVGVLLLIFALFEFFLRLPIP